VNVGKHRDLHHLQTLRPPDIAFHTLSYASSCTCELALVGVGLGLKKAQPDLAPTQRKGKDAVTVQNNHIFLEIERQKIALIRSLKLFSV
jgi:hypothetical protein